MFPEPPDGAVDRTSARCGNFGPISPGGGQRGETGEAPRSAGPLEAYLAAAVVRRRRRLMPRAAVIAAGTTAGVAERRRRNRACQQADREEHRSDALRLRHGPSFREGSDPTTLYGRQSL